MYEEKECFYMLYYDLMFTVTEWLNNLRMKVSQPCI